MRLAYEYKRDLDGHMIGHGSPFSLGDLPIDRMIAYVWWFFTREASDEERKKFEAKLWMPPTKDTPIPKQSPWSAENEMSAFSALKKETGA